MYPESVYSIASECKALGMDKYRAWDELIIRRGLRPGMNSDEFYAIFEAVTAKPKEIILPGDFTPTHFDTLLQKKCQLKQMDGYYEIVWEDGHTGSCPFGLHDPERFEELVRHETRAS